MGKKIQSVKDFTVNDFNTINNQIKNTDIANELAVQKGYKNARDAMDSINADINSPSKVKSTNGKRLAKQFTQELLLLVLYQYVEDMSSIGYVEYFSNMFDAGMMTEGNTAQFIQPLDTGADNYVANAFIPTGISEQFVETDTLNMYKAPGQLADNSYQFKKPLTLQEPLWFPYFMSGKLSQYIAQITAMMMRTYTFFKFDKLATFLTSITPQKVITGTAPNIFRAFADEIIPEIENMTLLNSTYNISDKSELISTVDKSNLLIILPAKLQSKLRAGVLSQLYNAKYLNLDDNYLSENIITLGDKLVIGDSNTKITVDSTKPYVKDTQIIVIDKRALRHLIQIERNESQSWAENMTIQLSLHIWGLFGILSWYKMMIYNNPNLLTLPTAINDVNNGNPITKKASKTEIVEPVENLDLDL